MHFFYKPYKFFVVGTDTEVGKTYVSTMLLKMFNSMGLKTLGLKPVASASQKINGGLYNEDAFILQQASSLKCDYDLINPFAFEPPIAPHIAADFEQAPLSKKQIIAKIQDAFSLPADVFIVEGVGGWSVPLNNQELMSDVVKALNIPIILVVGVKLGCLNHALLTVEAIRNANIPVAGWIANCIDPDALVIEENIQTLKRMIDYPCLGELKYMLSTQARHAGGQKYFARYAQARHAGDQKNYTTKE